MQNTLDDIDHMVLSLKAAVEGALDRLAVLRFEICTTEVLSNIVKHAHADDESALIEVVLTEKPQAVIVEVFDPIGARRFDPWTHATALRNIDPLAERGRGLGLVLHCADDVTYGSCGLRNRTALKFSKKLTILADANRQSHEE